MKPAKILFLAVGVATLAILGWLALQILGSLEVVDKGELLPYVQGYTIWKLRILGRFEFFVVDASN